MDETTDDLSKPWAVVPMYGDLSQEERGDWAIALDVHPVRFHIADRLDKRTAQHIADLHNRSLEDA